METCFVHEITNGGGRGSLRRPPHNLRKEKEEGTFVFFCANTNEVNQPREGPAFYLLFAGGISSVAFPRSVSVLENIVAEIRGEDISEPRQGMECFVCRAQTFWVRSRSKVSGERACARGSEKSKSKFGLLLRRAPSIRLPQCIGTKPPFSSKREKGRCRFPSPRFQPLLPSPLKSSGRNGRRRKKV